MVPTSPLSRCHLAREDVPHQSPAVPLTIVNPDKTGPSDLSIRIVWFLQFRVGAFGSYSFHVATRLN
jgi:hypothetical protein